MKTRAIVNPRAGLRAARFLAAVHDARWGGDPIEVRLTDHPRHASELAAEAVRDGCRRVLSVGGDGTLNEVATALLGTDVAMGIVPGGSGNGLARGIGVPLSPRDALAALEIAEARPIDVLRANGAPVFNVTGAGLDAEVSAAFHESTSAGGRRGILPYVWHAILVALRYRPVRWQVELDGAPWFDGPALLIAIANGPQYGAGALIAPEARLDDGLADVALVEPASVWELAWNAPRLFTGTIGRFRRLRAAQAQRIVLTTAAPFRVHRDGEADPPADRLEITVDRGALNLLFPRPRLLPAGEAG